MNLQELRDRVSRLLSELPASEFELVLSKDGVYDVEGTVWVLLEASPYPEALDDLEPTINQLHEALGDDSVKWSLQPNPFNDIYPAPWPNSMEEFTKRYSTVWKFGAFPDPASSHEHCIWCIEAMGEGDMVFFVWRSSEPDAVTEAEVPDPALRFRINHSLELICMFCWPAMKAKFGIRIASDYEPVYDPTVNVWR